MAFQPARYGVPASTDPVTHDLPPIRLGDEEIGVCLEVRRGEDGVWRGRLLFGSPGVAALRSTVEIFCAASEADLWQAVRDLREHHVRDLYRSLLS